MDKSRRNVVLSLPSQKLFVAVQNLPQKDGLAWREILREVGRVGEGSCFLSSRLAPNRWDFGGGARPQPAYIVCAPLDMSEK